MTGLQRAVLIELRTTNPRDLKELTTRVCGNANSDSRRRVESALAALQKKGLVRRIPHFETGRWKVTRKGRRS